MHSATMLLRALDVDSGGNRDPSGLVLTVCAAGLALAVYLSVRTAHVARERQWPTGWNLHVVVAQPGKEPISHVALGNPTKDHHWTNPHLFTPCDRPGCMWCDGGLEYCAICNAFEGATPTECVGRMMTEAEEQQVYAKKIDYRDGHWVNLT